MSPPLTLLNYAVNYKVNHFVNIDSFYNKFERGYESLFDYSQSKRALLPWLMHHSSLLDVKNLVVEHMYGPGDRVDKFIPALIRSVMSHYSDGMLLTPGDQIRDFICVDDVETPLGAVRLAMPKSVDEYATYLYSSLRAADERGLAKVVAIEPQGDGLAEAIRDRLIRSTYKAKH